MVLRLPNAVFGLYRVTKPPKRALTLYFVPLLGNNSITTSYSNNNLIAVALEFMELDGRVRRSVDYYECNKSKRAPREFWY